MGLEINRKLAALVKTLLPNNLQRGFVHLLGKGPTRARREANKWLKTQASEIEGHVLSLGSRTDEDGEGSFYRSYFRKCVSYTTSDVSLELDCDIMLDVKSMPSIESESVDCIFCSGVLEHVHDYTAALHEITRVLKKSGVLLLGVPFRQAIHDAPNDYWRFTEYGLRYLLKDLYDIEEIKPVDTKVPGFPAAYWVKARKLPNSEFRANSGDTIPSS